MKFLSRVSVGFLVLLLAASFLFSRHCVPRPGDVMETWQTANESFKVSIIARYEKNAILGGGYYTFRSAPLGSDEWREIMTFRHDDPVEIPKDQVRFIDDRVAYVFMGWMYAVTTDSGKNWTVWNAQWDLPRWECCNYRLISQVKLTPEGTGSMTLQAIPERKGEVPELQTEDYGRHWLLPSDLR